MCRSVSGSDVAYFMAPGLSPSTADPQMGYLMSDRMARIKYEAGNGNFNYF